MPKVPTFQRQRSGAIAPSGARVFTNVDKAAFGASTAGVDNASSRAVEMADNINRKETEKADKSKSREAINQALTVSRDLLNNKDTGFYKKRGRDAAESIGDYTKTWNETTQKLSSGLNTDRQREIFNEAIDRETLNFGTSTNRHAMQQSQKYDNATDESFIDNLAEDSALNVHNMDRVEGNLRQQQRTIEEFGERNGMDLNQVADIKREKLSKSHMGVIGSLVDKGGVDKASNYLKKYSKGMDKVSRDRATKLIELGKVDVDSQSIADDIFGKNEASMTEGLSALRSKNIKDTKTFDEAKRRLKDRYLEKKAADLFDDENTFQNMNDLLTKSKGKIEEIPKEEMAKLSVAQEDNLVRRARQLKEGSGAPKNSQSYYDLSTMAGNKATRKAFMTTNLLDPKYSSKIETGQLTELIKLQRDLRSGKGKADKTLDGIESKNNIVNSYLRKMEIDISKGASVEDVEKSMLYRSTVDDLIEEKSDELGRRLRNSEIREINDNYSVEIITDKGFFFDTTKPRFNLDLDESGSFEFDSIPRNEKKKMIESLERRGLPITEDAMMKMYEIKLSGTKK